MGTAAHKNANKSNFKKATSTHVSAEVSATLQPQSAQECNDHAVTPQSAAVLAIQSPKAAATPQKPPLIQLHHPTMKAHADKNIIQRLLPANLLTSTQHVLPCPRLTVNS